MKSCILFSWFASCIFLLGSFPLHADNGYYKVAVSGLVFEHSQKGQKEAMTERVSRWSEMMSVSVRLPASAGEAYNTILPSEANRSRWSRVNQRELELAFHLKEKKPASGIIDLWMPNDKMQAFKFTLDLTKAKPCTKEYFEKIRKLNYQQLSSEHLPGTAWFHYQSGVLEKEGADISGSRDTSLDDPFGSERETSLNSTFAIFSGGRAISENLALDRNLILAISKEKDKKPDVLIKDIKGVTVKAIDWAGRVPKDDIQVDPLSLAIPIDQHVLFAPSLKTLFALMDQIENDGAPMLQTFTVRNPFRTLPTRYKKQMGLDIPEMLAKLLPIQSIAITGGDPFFPMGTDIAVLFETDQPEILFKTLATTIEQKATKQNAHSLPFPRLTTDMQYRGYESTDRQFSSHLLRHGNLVVVANSSAQIKKLLKVTKSSSLGASDEYRFFRHRYPMVDNETAFIFLSDATIRRWASPQIRIGASRRTRSAAALSNLTSYVIDEKPPGDEFKPLLGRTTVNGKKVLSEHMGSLGFLTPVSEMTITSATAREAEAYNLWLRGYENGWAQVFDPIAIQLKLSKKKQELDITVLPLTVDSDYNEMLSLVGNAALSDKAKAVPSEALLYAAFAVDSQGQAFKQFNQSVLEMLPGLKINPLSWVGESISIYVENGFFWQIAQHAKLDENSIFQLPLAIRIESKSRMKLALFLTALKGMIDTSAPDLVRYEKRKHGKRSYVAVIGDEEELDMSLNLYYAALPSAFIISLDEDMLKRAIDREYQDVSQLKKLPDARHLLLDTSPQFLMGLSKLFDQKNFEQRRQAESWRAIPILNEWHRRFPNIKPEDLHRTAYASDLYCPGGKGYQWNDEALTMESVAYGHPTAPRNKATPLPWINQFNNLQTTFGFEDDGVRIKAKLEAKEKKTTQEKEATKPTGEILLTLKDDTMPQVGKVLLYKLSDHSGDNQTVRSETIEFKNNQSITKNTLTNSQGKKSTWISTSKLKKDGWYLMSIDRDIHNINYHAGYLTSPIPAIQGAVIKSTQSSTFTKNSKDSTLICESTINIIGLESIKVPAGEFKNCIKIEVQFLEILEGQFTKRNTTMWYSKNTGTVKTVTTSGGNTSTYELTEKIDPEK